MLKKFNPGINVVKTILISYHEHVLPVNIRPAESAVILPDFI